MKCINPQCHREIANDSRFCSYCGQPQTIDNSTQNWQKNTTDERAKYLNIAQVQGTLSAVKAYKEDHNCSLQEAKDKIDSWMSAGEDGNQSQEFRPYEEYELKMKERRKIHFKIYLFIITLVVVIILTVIEKKNSDITDNEREWAAEPKNYIEKAFDIDMKMVYVASGDFIMGCSDNDANCFSDQKPERLVSLSSYYIGMTEVTQQQWQKVMGSDIAQQRVLAGDTIVRGSVGDNYPMYYVSWEEANEFCRRLSQKSKHIYQLPTEAQWEYAARGGINNDQTIYSGSNILDSVSWNKANSELHVHPVGTRQCNSLAICDMNGNLWEHCLDWYADTYNPADTIEPCGPTTGTQRVLRGGSFLSQPIVCEVHYRDHADPSERTLIFGFRVVMIP